MKHQTSMAILRVLSLVDGKGGGVGVSLKFVADWAEIPRATTDRYLKALYELGLIQIHWTVWRGASRRLFSIGQDGRDWLAAK